MKNKLRNNNDLFNEYDKIIKDYMKEDIAEIIVPSENSVTRFRTLLEKPHRQGQYLVALHTAQMSHPLMTFYNRDSGPCLRTLICDILIRFRTKR